MLFNDLAILYDQFARSLDASRAPANRWLDGHLGSGRRALDVGCGVGRYTVMLADRYDDVVGIDVAPAMIEIAERDRSRPNIRYQTRDTLSLTPEHDSRFDLVLSVFSVLYIGSPGLVLDHLRRLVAKSGTLLILEPMWHPRWGSRDWQVDFVFHAARAAWEATGDMDDVANALQLVLSPRWREMIGISVPLAREDFFREYSTALPGVTIEEGSDLFRFGFLVVSWHATDEL